ncbi:MAG: alanine--tRNA ligase [Chlorobi bacterium]|nr:alanine--tRNA ligase [Chlorobiota bacterium]
MTSEQVRQQFLDFFRSRGHHIVPSAPMVVKNDPTLMFTNAGMNPFKDIFLGNRKSEYPRVANTQKCLRVSGKHNDLEEVGRDTYHHTMFEMMGNWSFGDYFKQEAISWAWEFLTGKMNIDPERLYATVFEGSTEENLEPDIESREIWKKILPAERILKGSKKDNFWEMGDNGPCGPCSEIHIDLRDDDDRKKVPGELLINKNHPLVIEIWNLVFIQFNRKNNGILLPLPQKHVDTGMGFERLCMVSQNKTSNYDTDLFGPIINEIEAISQLVYGNDKNTDVAMRVVADHLRAVAFAIADGQLPSNTGAGYVIRRILRRAVRYGYTYLNQKVPFIYKLLPVLVKVMGEAFSELKAQEKLISGVIYNEEQTFLRTLETGIRYLEGVIAENQGRKIAIIEGKTAFLLYDTYGFPVDLTDLIAREKGLSVDMSGFRQEMEKQKTRSKKAVRQESAEWIVLQEKNGGKFVGYDQLEEDVQITRYRKVREKNKQFFHLVFDKTPFYAESGGQVGDSGWINDGKGKIPVLDTRRENDLIIHITEKLPGQPGNVFHATVDIERRTTTACNHSATHLLHFALREILGTHVEQKGSLVHPEYLRFDFSHFQKLTNKEKEKVSERVNGLIRMNLSLEELKDIQLDQAKSMGAMSLFGEKYGEKVRVIRFGDSVELCGGTHVRQTGQIGCFVITSESSIAAGIRRIEAVTGKMAEKYVHEKIETIEKTGSLLKTSAGIVDQVQMLIDENYRLKKQLEKFSSEQLSSLVLQIKAKVQDKKFVKVAGEIVNVNNAKQLKDIAFRLKNQIPGLFLVLGAVIDGKPLLAVIIDDKLVRQHGFDARKIIKEVAPVIQGGGGGQPFYATAGGKNPDGLPEAVQKALQFVKK